MVFNVAGILALYINMIGQSELYNHIMCFLEEPYPTALQSVHSYNVFISATLIHVLHMVILK